jgi:FtsP/CotA-like multicopper oxidase with cupredoxin domain
VNGKTWPFLEVEQRRYRFRILNGCNSRFLALKFEHRAADVWQIGTEGGFLPAPVRINDLDVQGVGPVILLGLAERADVIVDFANVPVGTTFRLNVAPDEPFGGFPPDDPDDVAADPETTGQVIAVQGRGGDFGRHEHAARRAPSARDRCPAGGDEHPPGVPQRGRLGDRALLDGR